MFNKLLLTLTFISSVFGLQCYTKNDVMNSKSLFWYQNNVYDITGYKHPGGKSDLLKAVGNDLDIFFQMSKYDFHVGKNSVKNDLKDMLVGELKDTCSKTTKKPITTKSKTTTKSPITTTNSKTTTKSLDTTQEPLQNLTTTTESTIEPTTTKENFISNSSTLQYNFLTLIVFILVISVLN